MKDMIYFIAYLIEGDAKKYHERLCKKVSENFDIDKIVKSEIPPHITLKAPFETNNIEVVEEVIGNFAKKIENKPELTYGNFGSFKENVVYVDIQSKSDFEELIKDFHKTLLENFKWMQFYDTEKLLNFHATVAVGRNTKKNFHEINKFLENLPECEFELDFDNIAILKNENGIWKIHRVFRF